MNQKLTEEEYANKLVEALKELADGQFNIKLGYHAATNNNNKISIDINQPGKDGIIFYPDDAYADNADVHILAKIVIQKVIKQYKVGYPVEVERANTRLESFTAAKPYIFPNFVNAKENKEMLKSTPHILWNDLAIIFSINLSDIFGKAIMCIRNEAIENWNVTVEDLDNASRENAATLMPPLFAPLNNVLAAMECIDHKDLSDPKVRKECMRLFKLPSNDPAHLLTNKTGTYGAAEVIYSDVLQQYANVIDSDLYLILNSVDDALIVPVNACKSSAIDLQDLIATAPVNREDKLSDSVYIYNQKTKKIIIAAEDKKKEKK